MNKKLEEANHRLHEKYVPAQGPTGFLEIELLRASNGVMYDWYNNGWMCNNYTDCLEFLHDFGYFKDVSYVDLAEGNGEHLEDYMYAELEHLITVIEDLEKCSDFTVSEEDCRNEEYGLSTSDWDNLCFEEEEDDDDYGYDDEAYEEQEFD